jgi:hypothetical protein
LGRPPDRVRISHKLRQTKSMKSFRMTELSVSEGATVEPVKNEPQAKDASPLTPCSSCVVDDVVENEVAMPPVQHAVCVAPTKVALDCVSDANLVNPSNGKLHVETTSPRFQEEPLGETRLHKACCSATRIGEDPPQYDGSERVLGDTSPQPPLFLNKQDLPSVWELRHDGQATPFRGFNEANQDSFVSSGLGLADRGPLLETNQTMSQPASFPPEIEFVDPLGHGLAGSGPRLQGSAVFSVPPALSLAEARSPCPLPPQPSRSSRFLSTRSPRAGE